MSKILELLNYNKRREGAKRQAGGKFSYHVAQENFDHGTKEKLASTYIFNPVDADERIAGKRDKRILPAKNKAAQSGVRFAEFFPWLISFLAVLLLLINIAYRGKINIKIEILDKGVVASAPGPSEKISSDKGLTTDLKEADIAPIYTTLIAEGRVNRLTIEKIGFYGAAINKSRLLQDGLYLFNDGTAGWASAGMDLVRPMDLSDATLDFFIKGSGGSESLELILRDAESGTYLPQAHAIVFKGNMGSDWQFISMPFNGFQGAYNPKKIKHIGFEFGTQTTSNKPLASIYVKNIKIVKSAAVSKGNRR